MPGQQIVVLSLLGALGLSGAMSAEISGEVIAAHNRRTGSSALMSAADGRNFREGTCGGDLSHNGPPRFFIESVSGEVRLPDTYLNSVLVVSDEGCQWQQTLSGQPSNMRFSTVPAWSPDGARIAVSAQAFDLEQGIETESGVYLADVVYDASGQPVGIENLALEFRLPGGALVSWSGDGTRIAYSSGAPDGKGGQQLDIFVYHVGSGYSYNLTDTPDVEERATSWSPVDERIAFFRLVAVRGSARYDIFTISSAGGPVTQVTGKKTTGRPDNRDPCFSPDGQHLAFSSGDPWYRNDIFRIKADGSGKAVNLTAKQDGDYRLPFWRP